VTATFSPSCTADRAMELPGCANVVPLVVSTVSDVPSSFCMTKSPVATEVT